MQDEVQQEETRKDLNIADPIAGLVAQGDFLPKHTTLTKE